MTDGSDGSQLRPGLWQVVNDRYPGSMITKDDVVPLAALSKPLADCKVAFLSTSGVQTKDSLRFDTAHPVGDFTFRRVPSDASPDDLEIHQLKYPTFGAERDLNVIFPIERLRELSASGRIGALNRWFYTFIGYNMDPERVEQTLAKDVARALVDDEVDIALAAPA